MKDPVVQIGDPVLRAHALPVATKDITSPRVKRVIARMKAVLAKEEFGVAIAAPQIGESLRIFVVAGKVLKEEGVEETPRDMAFINPQITRRSRTTREMSEGCLSVRNKYGTVVRHEKVSIKAQDEDGSPLTYHGAGLLAHIFQHECDHLDGVLYVDKAVTLETDEEWKNTRERVQKA